LTGRNIRTKTELSGAPQVTKFGRSSSVGVGATYGGMTASNGVPKYRDEKATPPGTVVVGVVDGLDGDADAGRELDDDDDEVVDDDEQPANAARATPAVSSRAIVLMAAPCSGRGDGKTTGVDEP
jgi:hypothetical protein